MWLLVIGLALSVPLGEGARKPKRAPADEDSLPPSFCCGITGALLEDPVKSCYGDVFERRAIVEHVKLHGTCPLSNQPLALSQLDEVPLLKKELSVFRFERAITTSTAQATAL